MAGAVRRAMGVACCPNGARRVRSIPIRPNPTLAGPAELAELPAPGAECALRTFEPRMLGSQTLQCALPCVRQAHIAHRLGDPSHPGGCTRPASRFWSGNGNAARWFPPQAGAWPRVTVGRVWFWVRDTPTRLV